MTIREKATEALKHFKDYDKDVVGLEEIPPNWVVDLVIECHGDTWRSNWMYKTVRNFLVDIENCFDENVYEDGENCKDNILLYIEPDIYTSDLLDWAKDFPDYVDDVIQGRDWESFSELLQYAQVDHKRDIFDLMFNYLNKLKLDGD